MFDKLLIANRGEIACRIIRSAHRLGLRTVAVYSAADAGARHVRLADEAVPIGAAPAADSYLSIDRIVAAARASGAAAVHPGYGFLAENADFCDACQAAGLAWVGPPAAAMRAMGTKAEAKTLMAAAGVPVAPGYHGDNQLPALLRTEADAIGYPVLIKPVAGGGGKGMRVVTASRDFEAQLAASKREAAAAFGDDRVLVEKYLGHPRHIEIQVFADGHGNCVHLFERDCSVQRRHQKVLEEAPAPGMTPERRAAMGAAAVAAARAVGYVGAGTVEFIVSQDGAPLSNFSNFYFVEMNTRLQVEHPVTEMITGLDLVEWQLRVAAGEPLPFSQEQLAPRGHAMEARLYAEDPQRDFLPAAGRLVHLALPREDLHLRVDSGVDEGDQVSTYYDPLLAKLIVWDRDREAARHRLLQALADVRVVGVANNVEFLSRLAACPAFAAGDLDTGLIERERAFLLPAAEAPPSDVWWLAALAELLAEARAAQAARAWHVDPHSPWHARDGWRLNSRARRRLPFRHPCGDAEVEVRYGHAGYLFSRGEAVVHADGELGEDGQLHAQLDGRHLSATVVCAGQRRHVFLAGRTWVLEAPDPLYAEDARAAGGDVDALRAPMPGRVVALLAAPGQVAGGTPLLVLEAMKMEHTIRAPADGRLMAFRFQVGDQVAEGEELVQFEVDHGAA